MKIEASCHCGNIVIESNKLQDTITECNCSICRRLATRWMYFTSQEVAVTCNTQNSKPYLWGDKGIEFHHCPICGCTTHYVGTPSSGLDRIAINANLLEPKLTEYLTIRRFNGAEM